MAPTDSGHLGGSSREPRRRPQGPIRGAMKVLRLAVSLWSFVSFVVPNGLAGQIEPDGRRATSPDIPIDGPPAPLPPAVISRDARGNATVRAIRLDEPIRLDGRLDEAVYQNTLPVTGFFQTIPDEGEPATEETEAWITFDDESLYVSARLWESVPENEWVANEMRRDTQQLRNNDHFAVLLDTYYDRRSGFLFYTNPLGARADIQVANEGSPNLDWNPIWDVRTGRFEAGWTVEIQIPFKSLRYRPGPAQIWGLQLRRAIRRKNEWVHLTPIPQSAIARGIGGSAILRVSAAGTLVGLEAPEVSSNLELKPYVISGVETDRAAIPSVSNDGHADAGLDVKYGVTENLTADFTLNTDFAQVEADEQQVNLTRFELSFPEKREFFLEGRGIFEFAPAQFAAAARSENLPTLFFSRRIGLESGQLVPILAGARLTGKAGPFDVGALSIQTGKDSAIGVESTNFTVVRLRRDIFRRSGLGVLFTRRSALPGADGSSRTVGLDASMSFSQNLSLTAYYARTRTSAVTHDDQSYLGTLSYYSDLWGATVEHLRVEDNFNPGVGFVRRRGFRETRAIGRFSPQLESVDAIRRLTFQASLDYLEHATRGFVETRRQSAQFQIEFESSDVLDLLYSGIYEYLADDFEIHSGVVLLPGRYEFRDVGINLGLGLQRVFSGTVVLQRGSFYSGNKTTVGFQRGRINVNERLSLEPTLSFNWVDLPEGSFRSDLAVTRVNYAFSARMFFGGLVQYNSGNDSFSMNLRLRWEYRPGSELFVVYTEARDTDVVINRFPELSNRGLTVKVNYLFQL